MRRAGNLASALFTLGTILVASGCGSSSAHVRLVNAFPAESSLDMLIDGTNVASGVTYGAASGYVSVSSGSRHLQVEPTNVSSPVVDQTLTASSSSTITILSTSSGASILTDNNSAPSSGSVNIRVVNASSSLGTADIYVVAANTDISTVSPTSSNVGFGSASGYSTQTAGSYQVIFTQPGQKFPVISTSPLSFTSGQVRTVLGLNGLTGGFTTSVLADAN